MATNYEKLFCPHCGSMLQFPAAHPTAKCGLCKFERDAKEIESVEIVTILRPEDLMKRHNITHILLGEAGGDDQGKGQRATVDQPCPKCGHPKLEYYTRQMRSADEGQTVFYDCPNCKHSYQENS